MRTDFQTMMLLTKRDLKLFLKDKMAVFFSILSPFIVLLLYVLFLKKVQLDSMVEQLKVLVDIKFINEKQISTFLDGWLISGMLSIGCITVSLNANTIRVNDVTQGITNDVIVSPVKQYLVTLSYFLFNFIVTVFIMTLVFIVSLIYIAASNTWVLKAWEVFAAFGTLLFSCLSATLITGFITGFFKSNSALAPVVGITSALIGFLMGAYMPLTMMPKALQNFAVLLPATHSGAMFREFFMMGPLNEIQAGLPDIQMLENFAEELADGYSVRLDFFGHKIGSNWEALYIGVSSIIFLALNLIFSGKKIISKDRHIKLREKSKAN